MSEWTYSTFEIFLIITQVLRILLQHNLVKINNVWIEKILIKSEVNYIYLEKNFAEYFL